MNSIEDIWAAGRAISGGFGFWGSPELFAHRNPKTVVKAWVDGLRKLGYSDVNIVLYGDQISGRHIATEISPQMTYTAIKLLVTRKAHSSGEVALINRRDLTPVTWATLRTYLDT